MSAMLDLGLSSAIGCLASSLEKDLFHLHRLRAKSTNRSKALPPFSIIGRGICDIMQCKRSISLSAGQTLLISGNLDPTWTVCGVTAELALLNCSRGGRYENTA